MQNGSEMYNNLDLGENASRYINGHAPMVAGSSTKADIKRRNGKMVPNKDDLQLPGSPHTVDNKPKFADRLKVLMKTGTGVSDNGMEHNDPYAFSEPEPQVYRMYQNNPVPNNTYSRKSLNMNQATTKTVDTTLVDRAVLSNGQIGINGHSITRQYPALSASLGHSLPTSLLNNAINKSKMAVDSNSKTMNRLQAKIARNKVIGKHKKIHSSSRNPLPLNVSPKKERSLLEEQLLGIKTEFCVKKEPEESTPKSYKSQQHGMSHLVTMSIPAKRRRSLMASRQNSTPWHEALQRIRWAEESVRDYHQDLHPLGVELSESDCSDDEAGIFQKHWFSSWREEQRPGRRVGSVRAETRRRLAQVTRGVARGSRDKTRDELTLAVVTTAMRYPTRVAAHLQGTKWQGKRNRSKLAVLAKRTCGHRKGEEDACPSPALPCTQHCLQHVMYNVDQLLFEYCTAKFSDNTQCCVPVFDICHELPLCTEHARKRDNYDKMCAEVKPKKVRKKPKPSAMTRPNKRGKKKRRVQKLVEAAVNETNSFKPVHPTEFSEMGMTNLCGDNNFDMYIKEEIVESFTDPEIHVIMKDDHPVVEGVEEVLAMGLPLDTVELATQASRLLEEHDLSNVLSTGAFDDLFTEDKNTYEPTREETEELERALEAVDKDVKSLEKLSETQSLLETLLDSDALVQTLAQLPEAGPVFAYHNGYVVNSSGGRKCTEPPIHGSTVLQPNISISMQSQTNMPS